MTVRSGGVRFTRALLDLVLVAIVLAVASAIALDRLVPMTGGTTLIVGGPSMEPTIHVGSAVVTQPAEPAALAVGEVVSIRVGPGRAVFTHRIVQLVERTDGLWIRTKGDANADPDPSLVPANAVVGRVAFVAPWAGYVLALLSSIVGVFGVGALLLGLILTGWLFDDLVEAAERPRFAPVTGAPARVRPRSLGALPSPRHTARAGWTASTRSARPTLSSRPPRLPLAAAPIDVGQLVRDLRARRERRRRWAEAGRAG